MAWFLDIQWTRWRRKQSQYSLLPRLSPFTTFLTWFSASSPRTVTVPRRHHIHRQFDRPWNISCKASAWNDLRRTDMGQSGRLRGRRHNQTHSHGDRCCSQGSTASTGQKLVQMLEERQDYEYIMLTGSYDGARNLVRVTKDLPTPRRISS